jgi:predicted ester cyclase
MTAKITEFGRDYTSAWNSQKPENVASFFAVDGSLKVNDEPPMVGRTAIAEFASSFMKAFPDMKLTMDNLLIKADETQYYWSFIGTNTGADGTGNKVIFKGFERWTFNEEGLIEFSTGKFDEEDYNRQLNK